MSIKTDRTTLGDDQLALIIFDSINAFPHELRLYPDIYAGKVAENIRKSSYLTDELINRRKKSFFWRLWYQIRKPNE